MAKATISRKPVRYSRSISKAPSAPRELELNPAMAHLLKEHDPMVNLLDENLIAQAIWDCLKDNDPEGVVEVIQIHLEAVNKMKTAKQQNLSRATMYSVFRTKNPTVKTLAKLVNCCVNK
jgi:DNA-binding phage protein